VVPHTKEEGEEELAPRTTEDGNALSRRVAQRFLQRVWGLQPQQDGFVFLSVKDWSDGTWEDNPCPYPIESLKLPTLKDLYFAPCIFSRDRRRKENALPGRWLYADLDEVDPRSLDLEPTIAWETSPGRYQALWQLARPLRAEQLELLNQKLTYYTGADKGGWSLTKVLRVPGSISTKRESDYVVQNLWTDGPIHSAADLYKRIKDVETPRTVSAKLPPLKLPKASRSKILRKYRGSLPMTARKLLGASEATQGTRSERLWKLERLLLENGVTPEHTFVLVKGSVWNKYRGQQREDEQLWREINQAVVTTQDAKGAATPAVSTTSSARAKRGRSSTPSGSNGSSTDQRNLSLVAYADFVDKRIPRPMWMVEGIWSESAHGLIAGDPKTYKSVIATDLAISVASGTKFLDRFDVPQVGPVLMIQKENDEGLVQDRVHRIAYSRGMGEEASFNGQGLKYKPAKNLPMYFMNNADFDLTDGDDMEWLTRVIKKIKPVLAIFDPLYLLAPNVDENSAHQMAPILRNLLEIKQTYACGTLLIHHNSKPQENSPKRGAQKMSGTGAFHRWYESVMLLERPDIEEPVVKVYTEHRGQSPREAFQIRLDLGSPEDLYYDVELQPTGKAKFKKDRMDIRFLLAESDEAYVRVDAIADEVGIGIEAAKRRLQAEGVKVIKKRVDGKLRLVAKQERPT
jgi:hypothetical protein